MTAVSLNMALLKSDLKGGDQALKNNKLIAPKWQKIKRIYFKTYL
jgi:hypothetical protein